MNLKNIKVSIICVTYNHEKYIREALDSIVMQETNFDFEVLIGEDCSSDGTREILKEYEDRYPGLFRMFYRDVNMGASKNEYELFMAARGEYIAALELDDKWTDSKKLQKQYDFLETHKEYIGVAHDFDIIDKYGVVIENSDNMLIKNFFEQKFTFVDFMEYGFIFQTGTHFYRNIYRDGDDYSVVYKAHTLIRDLTILCILLSRGDFYIITDNMSAYRRFFDKNAVNGRNIIALDKPASYYDTARQLEVINKYLNGKVDLSPKWSTEIFDYFKALFKREKCGYKFTVFMGMYLRSSKFTKRKVNKKIISSVKRKFLRKI